MELAIESTDRQPKINDSETEDFSFFDLPKGKLLESSIDNRLNEMRNFVQNAIDRGEPWTDPDFKPELLSIFDSDQD